MTDVNSFQQKTNKREALIQLLDEEEGEAVDEKRQTPLRRFAIRNAKLPRKAFIQVLVEEEGEAVDAQRQAPQRRFAIRNAKLPRKLIGA